MDAMAILQITTYVIEQIRNSEGKIVSFMSFIALYNYLNQTIVMQNIQCSQKNDLKESPAVETEDDRMNNLR